MPEFFFLQDRKVPWWFDVVYPGEIKPRYMINLAKGSCTCMGNSMGDRCKHLKELELYATEISFGITNE